MTAIKAEVVKNSQPMVILASLLTGHYHIELLRALGQIKPNGQVKIDIFHENQVDYSAGFAFLSEFNSFLATNVPPLIAKINRLVCFWEL